MIIRIAIKSRKTHEITGWFCGGDIRDQFTTDPGRAVKFDDRTSAADALAELRRLRPRQSAIIGIVQE